MRVGVQQHARDEEHHRVPGLVAAAAVSGARGAGKDGRTVSEPPAGCECVVGIGRRGRTSEDLMREHPDVVAGLVCELTFPREFVQVM